MSRFWCLGLFALVFFANASESGAKVIGEVENAISAYNDFKRTTDFAPAVSAARKSIEAIQNYTWPEKGIDLPMRSAITVERFRCRLSWIIENYKNDFEYNPSGRATELPALNEGLAVCHRFKTEIVQKLPLPFEPGPASIVKPNPLRVMDTVGRLPTTDEQERINGIVQRAHEIYVGTDDRELFRLNYGYTNDEMRLPVVRVLEAQNATLDRTESGYVALRENIIPGIINNPGAWRFSDSRRFHIGYTTLECNRFVYVVPASDGKWGIQAQVSLAVDQNRSSAYFFNGNPMHIQNGLEMVILTSVAENTALAQRLMALAEALNRSNDVLRTCIDPQGQGAESAQLAEALMSDVNGVKDLIARVLERRSDFRKVVDEKCVTIGYLATASVDDPKVPLLKDALFIMENPAVGRLAWFGIHGKRTWMNLKMFDGYSMKPDEPAPKPLAK